MIGCESVPSRLINFGMAASPNPPALPAGLHLARNGSALVVTLNWRNMTSWALVPMTLVANGLAVAIGYKMRELPWNHPLQLVTLVFGGAALVLLYLVVRRLVNVTRLEVTPERITITHGPLPWRRGREVAKNTIRGIEVRAFHWHHKGNRIKHYHVWALQEHGQETCLLERDTTAEQANHVRDEIQRALLARPI